MAGRVGDLPASLDVGVLGRTMLEAARAAHIGVTVTVYEDSGPRMVYVNEAAAEIVGWSVEEIVARDPLASVAPDDLPRIRDRLEKRIRGEPGQATYEVTVIRKDGRRVPIEMTASPTTLDGRPAMFAFIMDVSACVRRLASASSSRTRQSPSALSGEAGSSMRTEPTCSSSATRPRKRSTPCR
jgi:PAS domain S-box-containing protein